MSRNRFVAACVWSFAGSREFGIPLHDTTGIGFFSRRNMTFLVAADFEFENVGQIAAVAIVRDVDYTHGAWPGGEWGQVNTWQLPTGRQMAGSVVRKPTMVSLPRAAARWLTPVSAPR